jgi:hypothetical protein
VWPRADPGELDDLQATKGPGALSQLEAHAADHDRTVHEGWARFGSSPTEVTITSRPDAARTQLADGPLPVRALVIDAAGLTTGEILVWMEDGCLSSAEHAWYTDDPPSAWPAVAQMVFA